MRRLRLVPQGLTDVGRQREANEDWFGMAEDLGLYVVCDGMGGHASGEVASRLTVDNVLAFVRKHRLNDASVLPYKCDAETRDGALLSNAIQFANDRVYIESMKDSNLEGMGTTVVAVLATEREMIVGHVVADSVRPFDQRHRAPEQFLFETDRLQVGESGHAVCVDVNDGRGRIDAAAQMRGHFVDRILRHEHERRARYAAFVGSEPRCDAAHKLRFARAELAGQCDDIARIERRRECAPEHERRFERVRFEGDGLGLRCVHGEYFRRDSLRGHGDKAGSPQRAQRAQR